MSQKISVVTDADALLEEFEQQRLSFIDGLGQNVGVNNHHIRSGAVGDKAYWEWDFTIEGTQDIYSTVVVFSNERGTGYDIAVTLEDEEANSYMTRLCSLEKASTEVFGALGRMIFNVIGYHDE